MKHLARCALSIALSSAAAAHAEPGPPDRPPPSMRELLATAPGIDVAQQQEIRRVESERRDAHDTLRIKQRGEHERIDEQAEQHLRKSLGDEGYRNYIAWKGAATSGPAGHHRNGRAGGLPRPPAAGEMPAPPARADGDTPAR